MNAIYHILLHPENKFFPSKKDKNLVWHTGIAQYMLNVIPLFVFNHSFLLCFLLNTCWWDQTIISQGWSQSSVHLFLKKPNKLCLLFLHVMLHKSQWWRSLCYLCLFNMIVRKRAKPSQLRFWMQSRYSLTFSASKSHPIPSPWF